MIRIAIIFTLILTLLIMIKSGVSTWQYNPLSAPQEIEELATGAIMDKSSINFFYEVPRPLPNLHENYLFNVDRILEVEEIIEPVEEEGKGLDIELDVDIETVSYVGSIITKDMHKAIVSYAIAQRRGFASRRRAARGAKAGGRTQASSKNKYIQLQIDDTFSGYKVTVIDPDKIVFEKDGEKVEKLLHDPEKKRNTKKTVAEAPGRKVAPRGKATPVQPRGSKMVTVGRPQSQVTGGGTKSKTTSATPPRRTPPPPVATTRMQPNKVTPVTRRRPRIVAPPGQPPPSGSTTGQ